MLYEIVRGLGDEVCRGEDGGDTISCGCFVFDLTFKGARHAKIEGDPAKGCFKCFRCAQKQGYRAKIQDCCRERLVPDKGRCLDNVFIERLWRSLKYELVYLMEFETGFEANQEIGDWIRFYNLQRPHSSLEGDKTPMEVYNEKMAA